MTKPVCIVMATYNGAEYIEEQIASIQAQSFENWRLLVRDDGSSDGTLDILSQLASGDSRITLLDTLPCALSGPSQNFSAGLEAALKTNSDLFFLADQDDIWSKDKLSIQSTKFPLIGSEEVPLLVHSDLAVVDESLHLTHPSLMSYMNLIPCPEKPLNYLLTRNFVTGCAAACNRQLLEASLPIPRQAIMHDWWLALVAASTGSIDYVDIPLVSYRQHRKNSIGAKGFWHGLNPTHNWIAGWKAGNAEYHATLDQVAAFDRFAASRSGWPQGKLKTVKQYLSLGALPFKKRLSAATQLELRQGSILLQLIFYARLLTLRHKTPLDR